MSTTLEVPNSWRPGVITNDGLGLLSKLVKGHSLIITRAVTGAGYVDPDTLAEQTEVSEPMQQVSFSTESYPEAGKCVIPCRLTNEKNTESYGHGKDIDRKMQNGLSGSPLHDCQGK